MTALLIWLLFAVIVGVAANGRGRSGPGWFVISAVVSPVIAALFLIAMPSRRAGWSDERSLPRERPEDDVLYRVGKLKATRHPSGNKAILVIAVLGLVSVGLYASGAIKIYTSP